MSMKIQVGVASQAPEAGRIRYAFCCTCGLDDAIVNAEHEGECEGDWDNYDRLRLEDHAEACLLRIAEK
jgi:hypothetical protein